jgi:hypothetical protein
MSSTGVPALTIPADDIDVLTNAAGLAHGGIVIV